MSTTAHAGCLVVSPTASVVTPLRLLTLLRLTVNATDFTTKDASSNRSSSGSNTDYEDSSSTTDRSSSTPLTRTVKSKIDDSLRLPQTWPLPLSQQVKAPVVATSPVAFKYSEACWPLLLPCQEKTPAEATPPIAFRSLLVH